VPPIRFERTTFPLGGGCSIQLSYGGGGDFPDATCHSSAIIRGRRFRDSPGFFGRFLVAWSMPLMDWIRYAKGIFCTTTRQRPSTRRYGCDVRARSLSTHLIASTIDMLLDESALDISSQTDLRRGFCVVWQTRMLRRLLQIIRPSIPLLCAWRWLRQDARPCMAVLAQCDAGCVDRLHLLWAPDSYDASQ
jgi:hypothetical protein